MALLQVVDIQNGKTSRQKIPYTIATFEEILSTGNERILSGKRATIFEFGSNAFNLGMVFIGDIKTYKTTKYFKDGIELDSILIAVIGDANGLDLAAKELEFYGAFPIDEQGKIYRPNKQKISLTQLIEQAKQIKGKGEGSLHFSFKNYVANNPRIIGLPKTVGNGLTEYCLPSTDLIDILFVDGKIKIGVEVKSRLSSDADILRGIFQCIKYKHLIEAEQILENEQPNSRVILVLEASLPTELIAVKNIFQIEILENITNPN